MCVAVCMHLPFNVQDVEVRAACERKALRFGRELLVHPERFASVHEVVEQAQKL